MRLSKLPSLFREEWRRVHRCKISKQCHRLFCPLINLTVSTISRCFRSGVTFFRWAEEICLHDQNGMSSSMLSNPLPVAGGMAGARFFSALNSGDASIFALRPFEKVSYIVQSGSAKRNI